MLLLSISATGIIFIRKGGGREGGRSTSLRYAPQTNLCFLNYLCQLRFHKLNKSITQVYFEPAGCPEGSVAHLLARWCAIPSRAAGTWWDMCQPIPHPPQNAGWEPPQKDGISKGKAGPSPLHNKAKPQRSHCSGDSKNGGKQ